MENSYKKYNLLYFNEKEAYSLNRPKRADEMEIVITKLPTHKSPGPDSFTREFYNHLRVS